MPNDDISDPLRALWQKQPDTRFSMKPEEMQRKFSQLQTRLRRRKYFAYIVCFVESLIFARWLIFTAQPAVMRIGCLLIVLGMNFLAGQIWLDNRERQQALQNSSAAAQTSCVDFYREELVRQRNFHRGVWFWSRLVALLPGLLLMSLWGTLHGSRDGLVVLLTTPVLAVVAVWRNHQASRKHQRQIEAIEEMKEIGRQ